MFPTNPESVDRAILLATIPDLEPPYFLTHPIAAATQLTRTRLVIVLFSRYFNIRHPHHLESTYAESLGLSHTDTWDAVQRILTFTYVQATKVAQEMDKVLMDIDVLLYGLNEDISPDLGKHLELCFRVSGDSIPTQLPESISFMRQSYLSAGARTSDSNVPTAVPSPARPSSAALSDHPSTTDPPRLYPVTALGGTFDHLHAGHKILLSMAAYITSEKLIVGITDDALLRSKSNKHVLQNLSTRSENVRAFLAFFKQSITPDIVPITDVYGPTGWDPNIQALVVSKETLGGAEQIASHRAKHALPPLRPFLIDVISATNASLDHADAVWLKENKLSSTFIRQWVANQLRKEGEGKRGEGEE